MSIFWDRDPMLSMHGTGHLGPFAPTDANRPAATGWARNPQVGSARRAAAARARQAGASPAAGRVIGGSIPTRSPLFRPSGPGSRTLARAAARRTPGFGAMWLDNMTSASLAPSLAINAAFGVATMYGTALSESARWGASTGHQEDYVGGWVAGKERGKYMAGGMMIGELIGTAIGAMIPGVGKIAAPVLGIVGSLIGEPIGAFVNRRSAYEKGRMASRNAAGAIAKRKVQFGRGFVDNQEAYTMRQMAVQEMSGSLLNARQYLGNEAFFMHR